MEIVGYVNCQTRAKTKSPKIYAQPYSSEAISDARFTHYVVSTFQTPPVPSSKYVHNSVQELHFQMILERQQWTKFSSPCPSFHRTGQNIFSAITFVGFQCLIEISPPVRKEMSFQKSPFVSRIPHKHLTRFPIHLLQITKLPFDSVPQNTGIRVLLHFFSHRFASRSVGIHFFSGLRMRTVWVTLT